MLTICANVQEPLGFARPWRFQSDPLKKIKRHKQSVGILPKCIAGRQAWGRDGIDAL